MTTTEFYETKLFGVEIDLSEVQGAAQPPLRTDRVPVASMLITAAAVTVVGVLTLVTPPASSLSALTPRSYETVVMDRARVAGVETPAAHRRAAERFRRLFRAVPLNDVEKLPDPDFGL